MSHKLYRRLRNSTRIRTGPSGSTAWGYAAIGNRGRSGSRISLDLGSCGDTPLVVVAFASTTDEDPGLDQGCLEALAGAACSRAPSSARFCTRSARL